VAQAVGQAGPAALSERARHELFLPRDVHRQEPSRPGRRSQQVAAAGLPAPGPRYLLDSGVRGGRAFRVVRARTSGGVRVDAVSTGILTRRADIAPSGQVAWGEIRVTATSSPGDECHSGTYREALGPQIGDALATAKARLKFVAPG